MVLIWPFVFYLFVFLRCARFLHIGDTMLFPITSFFASVDLRVTLENHKCSLRWRTWLNIPAEHQHVNIVSVSTLAQLHRATGCCSLLAWLVKSIDTQVLWFATWLLSRTSPCPFLPSVSHYYSLSPCSLCHSTVLFSFMSLLQWPWIQGGTIQLTVYKLPAW